jgi:hypothetical protein
MKRLLPSVLALALALLACFTLARAATLYKSDVTGTQSASGLNEGVLLNLTSRGDLPGVLTVSIKHDGGKVTGGSWSLTVLPPDAGPTSRERGRLSGSVTGGTLALDANGILSAADSLRLIVQSGAGEYVGVSGGGGVLSLSADPENATRLGGPLALDF